MNVHVSRTGSIAAIRVEGRMDAESYGAFEQHCLHAMADGVLFLIADLAALTYISSAGLGSFVKTGQLLRKKQGELILTGLTGLVQNVFELTRIITLFRVFDTPDDALRSLL